ncbi:MAG: hypothetical protein AAGB31_07645 [Bdellovibrio sp.]
MIKQIVSLSFASLLSVAAQAQCPQPAVKVAGVVTSVRTEKVDQALYSCYIQLAVTETEDKSCAEKASRAATQEAFAGEFKCEEAYSVGSSVVGTLLFTRDGNLFFSAQ